MFLSKMNTIQATKGGLAVLLMGCLWLPLGCFGEGAGRVTNGYAVEPGDFLRVSVWKEADLQQELLVRPDGGISFPLAGDILAAGRTVTEIRDVLVERIKDYIPEPEVTVQVLQIQGNTVYVMGKVNRPGAFVMTKQLDVTQALALAGGLATFADAGNISILRRSGGSQQAIAFNYKDCRVRSQPRPEYPAAPGRRRRRSPSRLSVFKQMGQMFGLAKGVFCSSFSCYAACR